MKNKAKLQALVTATAGTDGQGKTTFKQNSDDTIQSILHCGTYEISDMRICNLQSYGIENTNHLKFKQSLLDTTVPLY